MALESHLSYTMACMDPPRSNIAVRQVAKQNVGYSQTRDNPLLPQVGIFVVLGRYISPGLVAWRKICSVKGDAKLLGLGLEALHRRRAPKIRRKTGSRRGSAQR